MTQAPELPCSQNLSNALNTESQDTLRVKLLEQIARDISNFSQNESWRKGVIYDAMPLGIVQANHSLADLQRFRDDVARSGDVAAAIQRQREKFQEDARSGKLPWYTSPRYFGAEQSRRSRRSRRSSRK